MPESNKMVSLEQIRARNAFACAEAVGQNEKFLALARGLPAMFQDNGLLATWAFLLSNVKKRDEEHCRTVLKKVLAHLTDEHFGFEIQMTDDPEKVFIEEWIRGDSLTEGHKLMRLTAEAILFSGWLKRAAEALCRTS